MQFLSDVYLRCPDCDGRRYRDEILEVKVDGKSIADVLELTVAEAARFFRKHDAVLDRLQPLIDVGLEYLRLGQPVPTLSGGEAQRLKLAGHLADVDDEGNKLFLFDEPTTGLHFDDVAKLLRAFRQLLAAGPFAGRDRAQPRRDARLGLDHRPRARRRRRRRRAGVRRDPRARSWRMRRRIPAKRCASTRKPSRQPPAAREPRGQYLGTAIRIHKAREHNLKNIDVEIPRGRFTVVTGVSGSGKSTLAFDILFAEGQRRYLESLNAYARQFVQAASRPDVDAIFGIPPTVAIEQRTSRGGRKSTVGTLTEVHHFLRLLFVKLGTQYCPDCDVPIEPQSEEVIAARLLKQYRGAEDRRCSRRWSSTAKASTPTSPSGRCPRATGTCASTASCCSTRPFPRIDRFKEHTIELPVGDVVVSAKAETQLRQLLAKALEIGKGVVHVLGGKDSRGVLDQARLPLLRPQLPRARPAPVLLQLEARLVRGLLRHRPADRRRRVERRARAHRRRGQRARLVDRVARDRGRLPRVRRPAAQQGSARGALAGQEHRRVRGAADQAA